MIAASLALAILSGAFAVDRFAINTDINTLIASDLPWRERELAMDKAFPERGEVILAVVDAPTAELADAAAAALMARLEGRPNVFRSVNLQGASPFFRRNGLLFLPEDQVEQTVTGLIEAQPFIQRLAADPSLRGIAQALSLGMVGVRMDRLTLDDMARPLGLAAGAMENVVSGRAAHFSWHELMQGRPPRPEELRRFIQIHPVLDFGALEPGKVATDAVREAAADARLAQDYSARLRLTGPVPIADEEFATLQEGALVNGLATLVVVLVILWFALRSPKIIVAVAVNLIAGLAITAALGLIMVDALNLISVAFAVLFIGLGVDFGIQFSTRYRTERYENDNLGEALAEGASHVGAPLTLAATATAVGFLSFLPTDYRGLSELGQIAGAGMIIAFFTSITLLPALITVLNPSGEKSAVGYAALAPADRFIDRYRIPIVAGALLLALAGTPLLTQVRFDFNPINLRNAQVESVATFLDLRGDPTLGANAITVMAPTVPEAQRLAQRLERLPEVAESRTLASFIPANQPAKLALIERAEAALGPALKAKPAAPPSDSEIVAVLNRTAESLQQAAGAAGNGPGAQAAQRLAASLSQLARADARMRDRAQATFVTPLRIALADLRDLLQAKPVSLETLPATLVREWTAPDGQTRVELLPSGDSNDNETLRRFARAVLAVAPQALGGPISILESGDTIVGAFVEAGILALLVITILLWIALRRISDVMLTLIPLLWAGVITMEICVLIDLPLNFANIIALPLLLGIGVAFMIYYTMAWRAGQGNLLQSPLTRAVIWSALTTATAFGSLWLSSHPGTSSMGKLLALSLMTTLVAAVLLQPALLGRPRRTEER